MSEVNSSKPWYRSRILWLCCAAAFAALADGIANGAEVSHIVNVVFVSVISALRANTTKRLV